jgi:hypothetical protein
MRTIKRLLKIILKQGNQNFEKGNPYNSLYVDGYKGLCGFAADLRDKNIITPDEWDILKQFIVLNRPTEHSPHYDPKSEHQAYYWPKRLWKPRKAWLKDQIKL